MRKERKNKDSITQNAAAMQLSQKLKAQFMQDNQLNFTGALIATLLSAAINLALSWLLQQIIDAATGSNQVFNLFQLLIFSVSLAILLVAIVLLDRKTSPRFVEKALVQYKNMVYSEISKKASARLQRKIPLHTYQHYQMMPPVLKKTILQQYFR